jgi:hypothetical protein
MLLRYKPLQNAAILKSDDAKMLFYVMPVMSGKTLSTAQS